MSDVFLSFFKVAGLGGIFYWNRSVLVLTNPDLITKIACSDAEHFMNHPDTFQVDSILEKNLSVLTGKSTHTHIHILIQTVSFSSTPVRLIKK